MSSRSRSMRSREDASNTTQHISQHTPSQYNTPPHPTPSSSSPSFSAASSSHQGYDSSSVFPGSLSYHSASLGYPSSQQVPSALGQPSMKLRSGAFEDTSQMLPSSAYSSQVTPSSSLSSQSVPLSAFSSNPVPPPAPSPNPVPSSAHSLKPKTEFVTSMGSNIGTVSQQQQQQQEVPLSAYGGIASPTTHYYHNTNSSSASAIPLQNSSPWASPPLGATAAPSSSTNAGLPRSLSQNQAQQMQWGSGAMQTKESSLGHTSPVPAVFEEDVSFSKEMSLTNSFTASRNTTKSTQSPTQDADVAAGGLSRLSVCSGGSSASGASGGIPQAGNSTSEELYQTGDDELAACRRFTYDQIKTATGNFNQANFLSQGLYDSVYKGKLMGCRVAVKRLEGGGWQGPIEYRTEVEVLSRIRHPNIVLLMGHCPEEHCLVYEYLPGGTLQHSLEKTKGSIPLRWYERVKILSQIVDALLFLHQHEPPIVHRDLSPSNVLLDASGNIKLGDVGLARLLHEDDTVTAGAKGTPGYIDPEEVLTCEVSVLGDVYAFGLIGLQLITGEGNIQKLQKLLIEAGAGSSSSRGMSRTADVVVGKADELAGEWQLELTRQLVVMMLRCANAKRVRRPDLGEEVQPLMQTATERAAEESQRQKDGLHSQLMCPISKVRMRDPVLAADGFTYERASMEQWLMRTQMSPVTGRPLSHTLLTPNNSLKQLLTDP